MSGLEPWPGHCVVFLGKTLLFAQCRSTPRSVNGSTSGIMAGKSGEMVGDYL